MPTSLVRAAAGVLVLALMAVPAVAQPQQRPLALDDILSMEAFGAVSMSPDGRYGVYERRGPYDRSPRFDRGHRSSWAISELFLVDLQQVVPKPMRVLSDQHGGLLQGPWSPDGRHLVVFRFDGDALELGILRLADRFIAWTGLVPDMPIAGDFLAWRDDDRFVVTVRTDGSLPWILAHDGEVQSRSTEYWADMGSGAAATSLAVETRAGVAEADRRAPQLNLVELDVRTLETRVLTTGQLLDIAVSDNGAQIAVLKAGEGIPVPAGPARTDSLNHRARLSILTGRGDAHVPAGPPLDIAPHLLRWSASANTLLVWARRDDQTWSEGGLFQIEATGHVRPVPLPGLDPFAAGQTLGTLRGVRADWLGNGVLIHARKDGGRFDWHLLGADGSSRTITDHLEAPPARLASVWRDSALFYGDGGLWRVDTAGNLDRMTSAVSVRDATFHDVMKPIRLRLNTASRRHWGVGLKEGGGVVVTDDTNTSRLFSTAPLGGASVVAAASEDAVITLVRSQGTETLSLSRSGGITLLDRVNPEMQNLHLPRARAVVHFDRLGRRTTSWLYLPADIAPHALKGLVVMVYPGVPYDGSYLDPRVLLFSHRPELIASEGYAVLSPAMPTEDAAAEDPSLHVLSVDLAVDALFEMMPELPRGRTAVFGHSFGGTTALNIAARTDRYQSYIASSAVTDLFGTWGEFDPVTRLAPEEGMSVQFQMGWAETGQGATGGPPWSDLRRYIDASPYFRADQIKAPVLLMAGDLDYVPMSQAERMFTALHRRRVEARLVTLMGEGHTVWSPANIRATYAEIYAWLARTLGTPDGDRLNDPATADLPTRGPIPPGSPPP